jgi:predicted hydrolase (HD superfamily)
MNPTREQALQLLNNYIENPSLRKHSLSVGAIMRHFAQAAGEDAEKWEVVGLLHDLDYEKFPQEHCFKILEILKDYPAEYTRAIQSHGWSICTDVEPQSLMEKTLFAVDELSGLIIACSLVRPSKSIHEVEVSSIMKKFKNPSFAAGVDRNIVQKGADMLGTTVEQLAEKVLKALQQSADEIGIAGIFNPAS